jgi:hypothetical protein
MKEETAEKLKAYQSLLAHPGWRLLLAEIEAEKQKKIADPMSVTSLQIQAWIRAVSAILDRPSQFINSTALKERATVKGEQYE